MIGINRMYCNYCKMYTDCKTKTNLEIGPEVLIILLNRGKGLEFNVKIIFEENLNLDNYISYKNTAYSHMIFTIGINYVLCIWELSVLSILNFVNLKLFFKV